MGHWDVKMLGEEKLKNSEGVHLESICIFGNSHHK